MDQSTKENRKTARKKNTHSRSLTLENPPFAMISEFCNHNFEPEKLEEEKKKRSRSKIIEKRKKKKKKRSSSTHLRTFLYHKLAEDKILYS
jgi:hypothetical protein